MAMAIQPVKKLRKNASRAWQSRHLLDDVHLQITNEDEIYFGPQTSHFAVKFYG